MVGGQYSQRPMPARPRRFSASLRDFLARPLWLGPRGGACLVCQAWSDDGAVCPTCVSRHALFKPRCEACAIEVPLGVVRCGGCLRCPPTPSRAVAAVDYAYPWDGLIHRFKYRAAPELARPLVERLWPVVQQALAEGLPRPDLLVPVPLSAARLRERGYNQAWELARRLSRLTAVPARCDVLLRLVDAPHQQGLSREQRLKQARGTFAVAPQAVASLRGGRIALIDDVLTTGATVQAAADALLRAGAAQVQVWALARTPDPQVH